MTPEPAYLFDAYPHPRTSHLIVWIKHGDRVTKRLVPYRPDFCIKAEHSPLEEAERILADDERVDTTWRDRSILWLRGPDYPVLRVRPKRFQDIYSIAVDLRRATRSKGYTFYDVDNQPESRWMHDMGLWTMCRLRLDDAGRPLLEAHPDDERFTWDYETPDLRRVHLRVVVDAEGPTRDDVGFDDDLVLIHIGDRIIHVGTIGDPDAERAALLELGRQLKRIDPDVIFTQHGDRFDIPYLLTRIRRYGLERIVTLGRDEDPVVGSPDQKSKSIHTYGRWLFKTAAYYLRGRWHIDLSKKTLDSEDERKDIHGVLYLGRVSNRRVQDCNRNGAGYALQQMQIDLAQDLGVAIPWKRNLVEDWKDAATLCTVDRGGQIMVPTPGVYGDVAACDFSGYYPSLIIHHNLSSDSINCNCCPDGEMVPELGYHLCKQRGHQARVLQRLNSHRRWAKGVLKRVKDEVVYESVEQAQAAIHGKCDPRETDARGSVHLDGTWPEPAGPCADRDCWHHALTKDQIAKAKAIRSEHKALGVVCFGYFRYRNARFGCAEVHQAIQCYGRAGMTHARRIVHEEGYEMVHMMTDCTFIQKPGISRTDVLRVARRITNDVGVPLELEGIYRWIVFLPSKVHSHSERATVGVPNRYYGKFVETGDLKVRGIEVQRHSTPAWIYDTQQGMLDVFRQADTPEEFLAAIPAALQVAKAAADRLRCGEVDARSLGTMVQSTREVEEYAAHTNTKTALRRLRDSGTERKPGEYLKYVVSREDGPRDGRVIPVELFDAESPWFGDIGLTTHTAHYLRLLARSVETLLAPFGYWEDDVYEWLRGTTRYPIPSRSGRVAAAPRPEWVV